MKTLFAAALALGIGSVVGCGSSDDRDYDRDRDDRRVRDEQPMSQGGDRDASTRLQSDPVCGHTVNPLTSTREVYGDETYYFHNRECAKKFRDNPHAYLPGGDDRNLDDRDLDNDGIPDRKEREVR